MGWALLIQAYPSCAGSASWRPNLEGLRCKQPGLPWSTCRVLTHRHAAGTQDYPEAQKQLAAVGCPEALLYYCSIVIFGVACNEERVAAPVN